MVRGKACADLRVFTAGGCDATDAGFCMEAKKFPELRALIDTMIKTTQSDAKEAEK